MLFRHRLDVMIFIIAAVFSDLFLIFSFDLVAGTVFGVIVTLIILGFRALNKVSWHYAYPQLNWQPEREQTFFIKLVSGVLGVWSRLGLSGAANFLGVELVYGVCIILAVASVAYGLRLTYLRMA